MFGTLISSYHTSLCIPLCCYSAIGSRYPRYKYNHVIFPTQRFLETLGIGHLVKFATNNSNCKVEIFYDLTNFLTNFLEFS